MGTPGPSSFHSTEPPILTTELSGKHKLTGSARREIQNVSKFAEMPYEVLQLVINCLDMAEKACLLATCQCLRQLVEPLLYRSLSPDDTWKSYRRIRLLKTLGERQDLLPFIRSFRGFLIPTSLYGPHQLLEEDQEDDIWPNQHFRDEWLTIAVPLFTQAINIRNLEIKEVMDWGEDGGWERFEGLVSNMRLSSLALNYPSSRQLDFTPLLRGQQGLKRLELDCPMAQFEGLTTEDVPQLTFFKGTLSQAAMIVPGRPVKKLEVECVLNECLCLNEPTYQKLALSSEAIKDFKIVPHGESEDGRFRRILQLISQYLPKIGAFAILLGCTVSDEVFLDEIPKFSSLGRLRLLELEFPNPFTFTRNPEFLPVSDWGRLSGRLRELCPSLTDVEYTPRIMWSYVCGNAVWEERQRRREWL